VGGDERVGGLERSRRQPRRGGGAALAAATTAPLPEHDRHNRDQQLGLENEPDEEDERDATLLDNRKDGGRSRDETDDGPLLERPETRTKGAPMERQEGTVDDRAERSWMIEAGRKTGRDELTREAANNAPQTQAPREGGTPRPRGAREARDPRDARGCRQRPLPGA